MRPFAMDDVDDLHCLWVDPGVRKFLWDDQVIPRETAIAVVESSIESFGSLGIAVRHPNILRFRKRRRNRGFDGSKTDFTD